MLYMLSESLVRAGVNNLFAIAGRITLILVN